MCVSSTQTEGRTNHATAGVADPLTVNPITVTRLILETEHIDHI